MAKKCLIVTVVPLLRLENIKRDEKKKNKNKNKTKDRYFKYKKYIYMLKWSLK